jgi:hypothetical protein
MRYEIKKGVYQPSHGPLRVAATQRLLLMLARAVVDTEADSTCYVIADQEFARLAKWLSVRRCRTSRTSGSGV